MSTEETQQETLREAIERGAEEQNAPEEITEETTPETATQEAEPPVEEIPALEPIDGWNSEAKERFTALAGIENGRDYQQFLLDQYKSMQGDYTRKTQEHADNVKQYQSDMDAYRAIQQMIEPVIPAWQAQGMGVQQGLGQLLYYGQQLANDPQGTLLDLANQYGVDLQTALQEQPYVDQNDPQVKQVRALTEQVNALQTQLQQGQQAGVEHQQSKVSQQIESFRTATDENGQPKYPHFDQVRDLMGQLGMFDRYMGNQPDLESLYQKAIAMTPEIQQIEAEKREQAELKRRQAEAQAAKNATVEVSEKTQDAPDRELSLRETIERNAKAQGA